MKKEHPSFGNGKICYMEIPATDVEESSAFYQKSFGWTIRKDGDGNVSFDDAVTEVSGMWVTGRKPVAEGGILISIMVDSIAETLSLVTANGGKDLNPEEYRENQR